MTFTLLPFPARLATILVVMVLIATIDTAAQDATPVPSSAEQPGLQQADLSTVSGNIQRPNGMFWHLGTLFTSCTGDWTLYRIEPDTGETVAYIYGIKNANTLFAEGDESDVTLWIPDFQSNNLARIEQGQIAIVSSIDTPWGIDLVDADHFVVSSTQNGSLVLVNRDGNTRDLITGLRSPTGVAVQDEMVYVANSGSARRAVEVYDLTDLDLAEVVLEAAEAGQTLVTGVQNVTSIVIGPDGLLYMAYALGTRGVVGRVDPAICLANDGGCTNRDVEIVLYTELAAPLAGLTISEDMRLFIHTIYSPDIYSVQLDQ
jgi:sugar lactone lactonase YvrE